jgi:hypothetical protein
MLQGRRGNDLGRLNLRYTLRSSRRHHDNHERRWPNEMSLAMSIRYSDYNLPTTASLTTAGKDSALHLRAIYSFSLENSQSRTLVHPAFTATIGGRA